MEQKITIKPIKESKDTDKLTVDLASSLENEIRFYFNDRQYFVARDNNDGTFSISCEEEPEIEKIQHNEDFILTIIRKNINDKAFKKFLVLASIITLAIVSLVTIILILLAMVIKNALVYLLFVNFIFFSSQIILVMIDEYIGTSHSLRSKHSAEHMMVNFLEKNKRLPRNMKEIRAASRFSANCGSRKKIRYAVEDFTTNILAIIISIIIISFINQVFKDKIIISILFIVIYIAIYCYTWKLINEHKKFKFITKPIEKIFNNIVQCSNTTRKVKDFDIKLAYYAAWCWIQVVYPQFYSKEDDIFEKSEES